jgi:AcrR family transcriptional regulator
MSEPRHLRLVATGDARKADGRRQRGARNRRQIVEAMRALIGGGEMNPSAAQVAERAGVSLRSVFRHFEDMDSLYREIAALVEAEVMPLALRPFEASHWRDRLIELTARRADIFERIMPFRVAGAARRFQSAYLMDDYCRTMTLERSALQAIAPKEILADPLLFGALDVIVGFESWLRMRQHQGLSAKKAEAAMRLAVERLTAGL